MREEMVGRTMFDWLANSVVLASAGWEIESFIH